MGESGSCVPAWNGASGGPGFPIPNVQCSIPQSNPKFQTPNSNKAPSSKGRFWCGTRPRRVLAWNLQSTICNQQSPINNLQSTNLQSTNLQSHQARSALFHGGVFCAQAPLCAGPLSLPRRAAPLGSFSRGRRPRMRAGVLSDFSDHPPSQDAPKAGGKIDASWNNRIIAAILQHSAPP
jgi:hypothetical protein